MLRFENWKIAWILLLAVLGIAFATPNMFAKEDLVSWPDYVPKSQISLGLDLQGGAEVLFEVDITKLRAEKLERLREDVEQALRGKRGERASIRRTNLGIRDDVVRVRITNPEQLEEAKSRIGELAEPVSATLLGPSELNLQVQEADDQFLTVGYVDEAFKEIERSAIAQAVEILRIRIDPQGTKEATIQRQGDDRIVTQVPGVTADWIIARTAAAKMSFHMVDTRVTVAEAQAGRIPPGSELLPSDDLEAPFVLIRRAAEITGDRLRRAAPGFDQRTGEPIITFTFDTAGATKFAELSSKNVGRQFAIKLDEKVLSAPVIREPILGGSGQISGSFTPESAATLANMLNAGALPADIVPVQQSTVGAELGADSIAAGQAAALIGFSAVIVYIILSYGLFGVFANIALILNLIFVAAALSVFGATLTLPGIAGIVLTIGMAVDANVLIFERIREEVRAGKTPISAIESGYSKALGTILDANITTMIAALILLWIGSGPVKGFAVTLGIGIVTSVFTAFTVTRLMVATWLRRTRPQALTL